MSGYANCAINHILGGEYIKTYEPDEKGIVRLSDDTTDFHMEMVKNPELLKSIIYKDHDITDYMKHTVFKTGNPYTDGDVMFVSDNFHIVKSLINTGMDFNMKDFEAVADFCCFEEFNQHLGSSDCKRVSPYPTVPFESGLLSVPENRSSSEQILDLQVKMIMEINHSFPQMSVKNKDMDHSSFTKLMNVKKKMDSGYYDGKDDDENDNDGPDNPGE